MLPFGLIAGFAGEKEIRIIELAENGFTFRTAEKIADPELFRVCFYHYPKLEYEQVELHSYTPGLHRHPCGRRYHQRYRGHQDRC